MEPKRVFAEPLRIVESHQVHESNKQSRGVVEFEDGDQYEFRTETNVNEGNWYRAIGTFDEEYGKPIVMIEEIEE